MAASTKRDDGFTLVELLLVLAILAAATWFALPQARGPVRVAEFDAVADELVARLSEARTRAIARGTAVHVDFDPGGKRYAASGDARAITMPADIALTLVTARSVVTDLGGGRISFQPDGSATGGTVRLQRGGRRIDVTVSWLTGGVGLVRSP